MYDIRHLIGDLSIGLYRAVTDHTKSNFIATSESGDIGLCGVNSALAFLVTNVRYKILFCGCNSVIGIVKKV